MITDRAYRVSAAPRARRHSRSAKVRPPTKRPPTVRKPRREGLVGMVSMAGSPAGGRLEGIGHSSGRRRRGGGRTRRYLRPAGAVVLASGVSVQNFLKRPRLATIP